MQNIFPEDNQLINTIKHRIESESTLLTDFLNPWEISLVRNVLFEKKLNIEEWGGIQNASRIRLIATDKKIKQSMFNIYLVELIPDSPIILPNRKSVINTLNESGVPNNLTGDINKSGDSWFAFIDSRFFDVQIPKVLISKDPKLPDDCIPSKQPDISNTTSSIRLDSICAIAFKPSRGKIKGLIENGGAMVDYRFVSKGGKEINEGSIVSLRGFPRIRLKEIGDTSKKGRTRVTIEFL